MNKQELIKEYESIVKDNSLDLCGCYNRADKVFMKKIYKSVLEDLKQLDEPQKVKIPKFIADWIEYCKEHNFTLFGCLDPADGFESLAGETFKGDIRKCIRWCRRESNIFARAWLDGYEVEKEKRYLVQMKGVDSRTKYLYYGMGSKTWLFKTKLIDGFFRKSHTRKELEEAGFGEVFNSPLFEVEEVTE